VLATTFNKLCALHKFHHVVPGKDRRVAVRIGKELLLFFGAGKEVRSPLVPCAPPTVPKNPPVFVGEADRAISIQRERWITRRYGHR
jgi:hypothetical protein